MKLYRLSLEYVNGLWRVCKCRKVDPRWTSRVIDIDRRHSPKLRLRILGTWPHPKGRVVNPIGILKNYWKDLRRANV